MNIVMFGLAGMLLCTVTLAASPANQPLEVRNLITVTQFEQTGLNTLSPDELAVFNYWLTQYMNSQAAAMPAPLATPLDIRNVITVTEFDRAGLDKLSPDQIKALNSWLNQYLRSRAVGTSAAAAPAMAKVVPPSAVGNFGADTMPRPETTRTPDRIETRIAGKFTGWSGNTVFKLENGQVWQQDGTGYFTNVSLDHPQVVIKKLMFGYLLTLPGQGKTVFVRRIK